MKVSIYRINTYEQVHNSLKFSLFFFPFAFDPFLIFLAHLKKCHVFAETCICIATSALCCTDNIHHVQTLGNGVHNLLRIFD